MRMRRIIQFIHPGPEHGADRWDGRLGWKDWNRGKHKRKFLLADGAWTRSPQEAPTGGPVTFWGEWEPQSLVRRFVRSGKPFRPEHLHLPQLDLEVLENLPGITEWPCNTRVSCSDTNGPQILILSCSVIDFCMVIANKLPNQHLLPLMPET